MTALTTPARPGHNESPRPVPWRQLAWVSWRQYRFSLAGAVVFLGVLALYVLIMGLRIHSAYASVTSCHSSNSQACQDVNDLFGNTYYITAEVTDALLHVVPVLIGVFAGAPILARELETGTFRFAWTQGAGRVRWTVARLVLPAVTVTAMAAAFSQLFGWFYYPFFADGLDSPLAPQFFDLTGIAFAAWTLAAFAIGVFAGMLIRRVVPAIAAAMAAWTGLLLATVLFFRRHYMTPLLNKGYGAPSTSNPAAWIISTRWTGPNGQPVSNNNIISLLQRAPQGPAQQVGPNSYQRLVDPFQWLYQHGYTEWTTYQPANRFWPFQLIEGGWLLALSLLLIAATIWLVRRRAA
jgi:ABC-2 family transporter protein